MNDGALCCWCSGSAQQLVSVMNHSGETLSTVKYHEGFMGQRIAPVNCIAFHPLQVALHSRLINFQQLLEQTCTELGVY